METTILHGTPRTELGKKATRALRKAGNVPCNLYGGDKNYNFYAPLHEFRKLIYTPELRVAEIHLNGQVHRAILKETQFEPVKDTMLHADFQELREDVKVKVSIPLRLKGTPKGASAGGKLEQVVRRLQVVALPKDLVSYLEFDVSGMDLGAISRVRDLQAFYPNLTFLLSGANPIARVSVPRAAKEEAAAAPAAAAPAAPAPAAAKPEEKKK
ncbi:MAG: 50S ribosomal protein L25 [Chitinophagales bacterium]|nr:50S ribosomal protein L25 [Chitinophagales bacterium]MDW8419818.1 50S ribosomal protein L25 [Chitinophagales bacterium]